MEKKWTGRHHAQGELRAYFSFERSQLLKFNLRSVAGVSVKSFEKAPSRNLKPLIALEERLQYTLKR